MKKILFTAMVLTLGLASCVEDEQALTPKAPVQADYSKLVLNEINGTGADADKYIELYNGGKKEIDLTGVQVTYKGAVTWEGKGQKIAAGGYFVMQGTKGGDMSQGLSAAARVRIELLDPSGKVVDFFQRGNADGEKDTENTDYDYSRVPNGTGAWYYTPAAGTKGADNGKDTTGLMLIPSDVGNDPAGDETEGAVVLNELNGNDKFIEIYNVGAAEVDMSGYCIFKDSGVEATWTAPDGLKLAAGAYLLLYSVDVQANYADYDPTLFFNSGLSSKKAVRIELKNRDGETVDDFNLVTCTKTAPASYGRVPNGTGPWVYTSATPAAENTEAGDPVEGLE